LDGYDSLSQPDTTSSDLIPAGAIVIFFLSRPLSTSTVVSLFYRISNANNMNHFTKMTEAEYANGTTADISDDTTTDATARTLRRE
jgi:hypothetical protein